MLFYEIELTSNGSRSFLKAVAACSKHSQLIQFSPYVVGPTQTFAGLRLLSADEAGVSILTCQFESVFFNRVARIGFESNEDCGCVFNSKAIVKSFKGASPSKISKLELKLTSVSLELVFHWRNGMNSVRVVLPATSTIPFSCSDFPSSSFPMEFVALTTTPKYLSGLVALVPDSPSLWALSLTHQLDENTSHGSVIYVTNGCTGVQDMASVVGLTISLTELARNNSFIRDVQFPMGYTMKLPLTELRGITSLLSDDTITDDFTVTLGYSKLDGAYGEGRKLLTAQALPKTSSSHSAFSVKLWFKGCAVPETRDYEDNIKLEDLNLDDIDPQRDVIGSTPFIIASSAATLQQSASAGCTPIL